MATRAASLISRSTGRSRFRNRDAARTFRRRGTSTVVFDVVSASAEISDLKQRRRDYGSVPTVTDYVVIRYDVMSIEVWRRAEDGILRCPGAITDLNSVIELPGIGVEIPLKDVYDGVG